MKIPLTVAPKPEQMLLQSYDLNFKNIRLKMPNEILLSERDFRPNRTILQEFEFQMIQKVNQEIVKKSLFLMEQEEVLKMRMITDYKQRLNE